MVRLSPNQSILKLKNEMKLQITIIILLLAVIVGYSQNLSNTGDGIGVLEKYPNELLVARYVGANFKGMQKQFNDDWHYGDILLSDGKIIKNQRIRLNNFLNELLWLRETDYKIGILIKESINEFIIYSEGETTDKIFTKIKFPESLLENEKEIFVQVLVESEDTIICHRKFNKVGQLDDYSLTNQYYLIRNGRFYRFFPRRFSIFNLYENEENKKMKSIIRSGHLHIRKEDQMIKAFELFYK